ncbi:MAG: FecR domain-containing protein [Chitinophagaceae bacterium]|nr:FecR domain-containing protein [Chitinophagaceae bacterium]MBP7108686.1 FecR domain-containing protein [Chitinophagaceae bacterium]MBP7313736.1 FecR domain-containing protein [Chitinophagaceae bacterium]HQZ78644.1 FecR domain-containing protein [Bacteroidia bacterium]
MQDLFQKYLDNQCSSEEIKEVLAYFANAKNETELRSFILNSLASDNEFSAEGESYFNKISEKAYQQITKRKSKIPLVIPFYRKSWFKVAAAAVLLIGAFAIYKLIGISKPELPIAKVENTKQDVAPGGNKAILTLADGSTIILDTAANGKLTQQGNSNIVKLNNGQLAYNTLNEKPTEIVYNTISTPRGGQYQLTLADGSKVWLNAASSLRFPASFTGNERKVEITGEAYFEIAKNASMPFIVSANGLNVEVLGTHFNINSYADEAAITTTLLEGAVKVSKGNALQLLSPGQQAQVTNNGPIRVSKIIDVEEVMAWKNGSFVFNSTDIENIMRQISRWYDVDVSFDGSISKELFSGIVSRTSKLSQVLKIMERAGVKFKIEGKRIVVM